jgi:hypothetical protein
MNTNWAKLCLCAVVVMVVYPAFAADNPTDTKPANTSADGQEMHARHFDSRINTWTEGNVTSIDYDRNTFKVHGKQLSFASTHAQMNKDLNDRMKNADATQREKLAADVKRDWKDRLEKARAAAAAEPEKDFNLTFASDGKVKEETDLNRHLREANQQANADQPKLVGELVIVQIYEVPENMSFDQNTKTTDRTTNADNRSEEKPIATSNDQNASRSKLTLRDIKSGDKVMVGFDSASNQAYLVVRENKSSR